MPQSTKTIKSRIKSVEGTKQITKAMELVAVSKIRRAEDRMKNARGYFSSMRSMADEIAERSTDFTSPFCTSNAELSTCHVVIAGDRGLAGGYNMNLFKSLYINDGDYVLPIGKKGIEYFQKKNVVIISDEYKNTEKITINDCNEIAYLLALEYNKNKYGRIDVYYTSFINMLSFVPGKEVLLPFLQKESRNEKKSLMIYDPSPAAVFEALVPIYMAGVIYGAVTESVVCELSARRNAMQSANKNADEMIGNLTLEYNRLRQSAITREITEIISGSENL